jgi:hypothetical protein
MNVQQILRTFLFESKDFEARPLSFGAATPQQIASAAWKGNYIIRKCAAHESFFSDYFKGCDGKCSGFCDNLDENCSRAQAAVIRALTSPNTMSWEIHAKHTDGVDLVGILRLSDIKLGCDAKAHYFFFDGKLRDKTEILKSWSDWVFSEHPGWPAINRITIEVPAHAFALARHAQKHLGFGGDYVFKSKGNDLRVEGVLRNAIRWREAWWDMLIMGKIKEK